MESVQSINLIATNAAVRGGRPFIIGTSVTVSDVAIAKIYHGLDADGVASWYDLTLAQVYAALAYYYERKSEIDDQIREQIRRSEAIRQTLVDREDSLLPR